MSVENARKFIQSALVGDEATSALLPENTDKNTIEFASLEDFSRITKVAQEAGWEFTAEELQEACVELFEVDDTELNTVIGGGSCWDDECKGTEGASEGHGGCSSNYYQESCKATVEEGSRCNCTDYTPSSYHKC